MGLKDQFADDVDNVFLNESEFAEEIIYVAQETQSQYTISAIVDYLKDPEIAGVAVAQYAEIMVDASDIPTVQNQDIVWIGGVDWIVERLQESESHIEKILIRRKESAQIR